MASRYFRRPKYHQRLTKRDIIVLISAMVYLALNVGVGLLLAHIYAG